MRKFVLTAALLTGTSLAAQTPAAVQAPAPPPALEVGVDAPDFALAGATRYGVLRNQVRLSDYKGKTVVLAFFFRARSRG